MHRLHTLTLESTLFCCKPDEATLRLGLKSRAGCNRAEAANERWKPEYSLSHSVWTEHQSPAESREKANVYFYFARFYFCPVYNSAQARWLNHHLLACGSFATLRAITSLNALFLRPCDLLSGLWMTFLRCWARNKIEKKLIIGGDLRLKFASVVKTRVSTWSPRASQLTTVSKNFFSKNKKKRWKLSCVFANCCSQLKFGKTKVMERNKINSWRDERFALTPTCFVNASRYELQQ